MRPESHPEAVTGPGGHPDVAIIPGVGTETTTMPGEYRDAGTMPRYRPEARTMRGGGPGTVTGPGGHPDIALAHGEGATASLAREQGTMASQAGGDGATTVLACRKGTIQTYPHLHSASSAAPSLAGAAVPKGRALCTRYKSKTKAVALAEFPRGNNTIHTPKPAPKSARVASRAVQQSANINKKAKGGQMHS